MGSGQFPVRGWERGKQLTLVRNPRYWGLHVAHLDRLVLRFRMGNEEAIEGLRRGELDLVHGLPLTVDETRKVRQLAAIRVQSVPGPGWIHLELRVRAPGSSGPARQARAEGDRACDRQARPRPCPGPGCPSGGTRRPTAPSSRPPAATTGRTGAASVTTRPSRLGSSGRPAAAAARTESTSAQGERLSLRGLTIAGNPSFERALRIISEQLGRAGIEVRPEFAALGTLFGPSGIVPSGAFDLLIFSWVRTSDEPSMNQILRCGRYPELHRLLRGTVTRDLDEVGRVLDVDQRARVLNRIDARVALDVPLLPLYHLPLIGAGSASLRGYALAPSGPLDPFVGAENWWLARG